MKSNEEFRSDVYERFEKYKIEKAKKRRNIVRYGSITMSALIVAVAVASPTFFGMMGYSQSAPYDGISLSEAENEINVYSQKSGVDTMGSFENTSVYSIDQTPNSSEEDVTACGEDTRKGTEALSTAAATQAASTPAAITAEEASTAAATVGEATVLDTTACATANVTETTASGNEFNTTPKISFSDIKSIEKYFIGTEVFANEESAANAENSAKSAGVDIKKYKFCNHSSDGERSCVALNFYGSLNVVNCSDDEKNVVVTGYIINTDVEPMSKSMNIFIFDGDRDIVFNIKTRSNEKEDG